MWQRARRIVGAAMVAAGSLSVATHSAHADAIDGQWCQGPSHFVIEGPNILTPGGARIQGSYSRHGFVYILPANEPGAGGEIDMVLLSEETVQFTHKGQATTAPEIWRRCKPTS